MSEPRDETVTGQANYRTQFTGPSLGTEAELQDARVTMRVDAGQVIGVMRRADPPNQPKVRPIRARLLEPR